MLSTEMTRLRFCHFCGKELVPKVLLDGSTEKYCAECNHVFFDEPSPAVIVAITSKDMMLLTRSKEWTHPYWGLVAGHVKTGETAEEAAVREVTEEVGLSLTGLEILGTYAQKGGDFLMVGFRAETNSLEIKRSQELEKAEWFSLQEPLPLRPNSISYQIAVRIFPNIRLAEPERTLS